MVNVNLRQKETHMDALLRRLVRSEEGQDLIEYGLLVGIITAACVASIQAIGPVVAGYYAELEGVLIPAP